MQGGRNAACCVVLMMKSAARSKRRLAEHIGARRATLAAQRLLDCACEDLEAWPGPKCAAPSAADERVDAPPADALVVQRGGDLGARIHRVNEELMRLGSSSNCTSASIARASMSRTSSARRSRSATTTRCSARPPTAASC